MVLRILLRIVQDARLKALPDEKFKSEFNIKKDPAVALVDEGLELFSNKTGQYRKNLIKVNVEVKWEPAKVEKNPPGFVGGITRNRRCGAYLL